MRSGIGRRANVAEEFSDEVKKRSGDETVVSDLTYDLRSGAPDFIDNMVAATFGTMAYDCIHTNRHGLMAAVSEGKFAMVPIPDPQLGPRHVDVEHMYNEDRYRPSYADKEGMPLFLTRA